MKLFTYIFIINIVFLFFAPQGVNFACAKESPTMTLEKIISGDTNSYAESFKSFWQKDKKNVGKPMTEGETTLAPFVLAFYVTDVRKGEDELNVIKALAKGDDKRGLVELAKIYHIAEIAPRLTKGERGFDNEIVVLSPTGKKIKFPARTDFKSYYSLSKEVAELYIQAIKPSANWILTWLEKNKSGQDLEKFYTNLTAYAETAAEDAHNNGWKKAKDIAFANPNDPFLGYGEKRIKTSQKTKEIAANDNAKENLATYLKINPQIITPEKIAAIKNSPDGKDITHTLYKPFKEILKEQADGGTKLLGQNSMPFLVLALYIRDFKKDEAATPEGMKKILTGIINGEDKKTIEEISIIHHIAFQSVQLAGGARSYETEKDETAKTGKLIKIPAKDDFLPYGGLKSERKKHLSGIMQTAAKWLLKEMTINK